MYPSLPRDLAVAPDGTVWAATDVGVFSFDGAEWTRRFDDPAWAVAVGRGRHGVDQRRAGRQDE